MIEKISEKISKISPKQFVLATILAGTVGTVAYQTISREKEIIQNTSYKNTRVTFVREGNFRQIIAEGKDLETVHRAASNEFSHYLEDDFKGDFDFNSIDGNSFHSSIRKQKDGNYRMTYTLNIVPKNMISVLQGEEKIVKIVDLRGAVIEGSNPKASVQNINKSRIPEWQAKMGKYAEERGANMQYISSKHEEGNLYLETVLGIGVKKQQK